MSNRKQNILRALQEFVNQRPGLSFADYGDAKYYRQDYRQILQAKQDFEQLLVTVDLRDNITADDIIKASKSAFSGRLTITENGDSVTIDYCTGQYMPTEYRKAACAVLASALWGFWREPESTGDTIRKSARDNLGRGIASRWFN